MLFLLSSTLFKVIHSAADISAAVLNMANLIDDDWAKVTRIDPTAKLTLVVVMSGAWHFASALSLAMRTPHQVAFVRVSSYQGTQQAQTPQCLWWQKPGDNHYLLLVEDIADTGHTLRLLQTQLRPEWSLWKTASLLDKPKARQVEVTLDYKGFTVEPDQFVVGYGLDVDNNYRDLPFIGLYTLA